MGFLLTVTIQLLCQTFPLMFWIWVVFQMQNKIAFNHFFGFGNIVLLYYDHSYEEPSFDGFLVAAPCLAVWQIFCKILIFHIFSFHKSCTRARTRAKVLAHLHFHDFFDISDKYLSQSYRKHSVKLYVHISCLKKDKKSLENSEYVLSAWNL